MPLASPPAPPPTFLEALIPLYHAGLSTTGSVVAEALTLPAQVVVSFLLVAAAALVLRRRRRIEPAAGWLAAWALGTAVEVVCKHALERPALYRGGVHVVAYDASWPSGHTLRAVVVAGALAAAWPRARAAIWLWCAAAVALLVGGGFHTASDVAGGLLLALLVSVGALALERSALLRRRAALRAAGAGAAAPRGRRA